MSSLFKKDFGNVKMHADSPLKASFYILIKRANIVKYLMSDLTEWWEEVDWNCQVFLRLSRLSQIGSSTLGIELNCY